MGFKNRLVNTTKEPSRITGYFSRHTPEICFVSFGRNPNEAMKTYSIHERNILFQLEARNGFALFTLSKTAPALSFNAKAHHVSDIVHNHPLISLDAENRCS
jgi:hypothetical protein